MKIKYVVEIQYANSDGKIISKVVAEFDNWSDAQDHNDRLVLEYEQRSSIRRKVRLPI